MAFRNEQQIITLFPKVDLFPSADVGVRNQLNQ